MGFVAGARSTVSRDSSNAECNPIERCPDSPPDNGRSSFDASGGKLRFALARFVKDRVRLKFLLVLYRFSSTHAGKTWTARARTQAPTAPASRTGHHV
eukprot:scaffold7513_cov296-Pinguiococcus_pyrenoidosus.AAC.7